MGSRRVMSLWYCLERCSDRGFREEGAERLLCYWLAGAWDYETEASSFCFVCVICGALVVGGLSLDLAEGIGCQARHRLSRPASALERHLVVARVRVPLVC